MLRNLIAVLLTCLLSLFAQAQQFTSRVDDISGAWILTELFPDETHTHRMSLQVADNKITGHSGASKIEGAIADSVITLKWLNTDGSEQATYTGTAQRGTLRGEGMWQGIKLQWSARRPTARPEGGPRLHPPSSIADSLMLFHLRFESFQVTQ